MNANFLMQNNKIAQSQSTQLNFIIKQARGPKHKQTSLSVQSSTSSLFFLVEACSVLMLFSFVNVEIS